MCKFVPYGRKDFVCKRVTSIYSCAASHVILHTNRDERNMKIFAITLLVFEGLIGLKIINKVVILMLQFHGL